MKREYGVALAAAGAVVVPGLVLAALGAPAVAAVIVTIALAVAAILVFQRRYYRHITARIDAQTMHLRSVIGQVALADGMPIHWSEHAITPETLSLVQHLAAHVRGPRILELGSGVSTLLMAQSLRRAGEGHILSLDDDARWAAQTEATIAREKLGSFARVVVAPLVKVEAGGRQSSWYDISSIEAEARFDLIIVDGPPAWRGDELVRLPALYQLRKHLSDQGLLVLDDAARGGEREVARRWRHDFPDLHFKMLNVGRGLFVVSVQSGTLDLLPEE
jgi:predicted O-methyltransferase YrrM